MFKRVFLILFAIFIMLASANVALASFGISPPYVRNDRLTQNSHYEEKIILVRDDPIEDWKAEVTIDMPQAEKWISIDKGTEFILPQGKKQVPIIINVDVPKKAKYGSYKGYIRIKTFPLATLAKEGTVTVALGGRIDVDLNVVKGEIFDFKVRGINVSDLEEGHTFRFWHFQRYFPGKIKFAMQIENIGNIKAAPTRVYFDIYDTQEKELLESTETVKMKKIKPFATEWIIAELPTKLKPGSYWAQFKIFKNNEVVNEGKIHLSILASGTIPHAAKKFSDFRIWIFIAAGLIVLAGIICSGWIIGKKLKHKKLKQKKN